MYRDRGRYAWGKSWVSPDPSTSNQRLGGSDPTATTVSPLHRRRVSYCPGQPWGHGLCVLAFPQEATNCCEYDSSHQFMLVLNLTPCRQRTLHLTFPALPRNELPSSLEIAPYHLQVTNVYHSPRSFGFDRTLDLDPLSDNRRWAETTQRHSGYLQNNRHPMKSRN